MFRQLTIICCLLIPITTFGQQYKPVSISLADGLSQSSVYGIIQDRHGFTWMATQDGLNRFDGTSFYVYRDEPFDSNSISSNYINDLLCDSKGRIWVGTANHGLNLLLPGKETFIRLDTQQDTTYGYNANIINDLYEDPEGTIWIGTGSGLLRLSEKSKNGNPVFAFEKVPLFISAQDSFPDKYVNKIISDHRNQLWVATYGGLFRIDGSKAQITADDIHWLGNKQDDLPDHAMLSLTIDASGNIWTGGRNGLRVFNPDGVRIASYMTNDKSGAGMAGDHINALYTASNGDIWIGYSDEGVQVIRGESIKNRVQFVRPEVTDECGILRQGNAISFCEDQITPGIIWIGFNAGGLVRLVPVTKKFITNNLTDSPIPTSFVANILSDHDNNVWIGTHAGLLKYNRSTRKYQAFIPSKITGKDNAENYISGLVTTTNGDILFGSGNNLFTIKNTGGKSAVSFITISDTMSGYRNNLRTITSDYNGNVYLILRYGIYRYFPETGTVQNQIRINDKDNRNDKGFFISTYFIDQAGNHWVGSSGGINYYPRLPGRNTADFTSPLRFRHNPRDTTSLRNNSILCFAEDNNHQIWLGTMNGLSKVVNRKDGSKAFVNYSTKNGLKNNVIYSILPDRKTGHLWLSTNNGLTEFDPAGFAIVTYDLHDGLQSNEFNSYAGFISDSGEMFFGGINGYTSFYPGQILRDTTPPRILISDMVINGNRRVNLTDFSQSKTINLKYKDNSFSVNFTGFHYVDPQKNRYAYMLEGFQSDWTYTGNIGSVNFSQLPPGKYIFRVKAANSDGVFNESGDMFVINIDPPFYKTIWFYFLIAVVIAGVVYGMFRYRLQMKMEQVKEVEKIRRATAADFHDELGHKLTIISWFAEILKKKITPDQKDLRQHLDKIIEASGNLYHTMKDMLWAMDPDKDSVSDLYNQIREFGQELFDSTGIEFEAGDIPTSLRDEIISPAHKRHVLLIFKEVMHNSLKHAHGNSTALDLVSENGFIKFRFRDNGNGFRMNGHNVGRGLENVKRRARHINAIIQIHSEDTGTVAELDIPVDQLQ